MILIKKGTVTVTKNGYFRLLQVYLSCFCASSLGYIIL